MIFCIIFTLVSFLFLGLAIFSDDTDRTIVFLICLLVSIIIVSTVGSCMSANSGKIDEIQKFAYNYYHMDTATFSEYEKLEFNNKIDSYNHWIRNAQITYQNYNILSLYSKDVLQLQEFELIK